MDDPIGKAGLAHYFEHLMFETTGKFTDIEATMSSIGAQFNAFTTKEYTCYYELVPKKDLPLTMEVEADRMGNFNVTQDKIDREKNIVLEERKMRFDNQPHNLLWEEMDSAFYRNGYGRSVIGWESDIKTYNQDDIVRFHDSYYHPGNAILLIVGDVEFDEVVKLAEEKYGEIKAKPVMRNYPNQDPVHNAGLSVTLESTEVKEPVLYFRYRVPLFEHINEASAAHLAVDILGGGKSSKLYKDLVLDKDVAVSVFAEYDSLTFSDGYIDIQVIPKSGVNLDIVERELDNAINNFMSKGITDEELQSSKYRYKAAQFDNLSSLDNIAFFYGSRLALDAGYAYENVEKQGLAWFTSLIVQEGAGKNDAKDFAKKLEDKGISLRFSAGLETFGVSLDTLSENLEEGVSLLSDAITRPKVDSEGLNRVFEKAKVDFNNLEKNPFFVAGKELETLLFKKHPYSKSEYGTLDTITNITRDDVLTYIKRNFAKDNIIISVAGCAKKEEIITLLDKYLSKLPSKRSKVRKIPVKNDFGPAENKNIFMDIPQSVILFAQKGIAYEDPNYYNASVLINALGGMGLNSILMKELRQNLGITYGVYASIIPNKHGNVIVGSINTDSATASQSISAIKDTLSKVRKEGIDEQLFRDTKISMVNSHVFSMFNNNSIVAKLNDIQTNSRDINHMNDFVSYINDVKLEEVNELASSLLDPENLFFVEVGRNT
ncbi:uncharacterized zinc protease-like protein y4wB [Euwallacea similis]|uniref:uncharacterized zinc protease-like protein y4wB n=1 Tax=Euwallacea similis TaxID=1736056 RepID=UPI00344C9BE0